MQRWERPPRIVSLSPLSLLGQPLSLRCVARLVSSSSGSFLVPTGPFLCTCTGKGIQKRGREGRARSDPCATVRSFLGIRALFSSFSGFAHPSDIDHTMAGGLLRASRTDATAKTLGPRSGQPDHLRGRQSWPAGMDAKNGTKCFVETKTRRACICVSSPFFQVNVPVQHPHKRKHGNQGGGGGGVKQANENS